MKWHLEYTTAMYDLTLTHRASVMGVAHVGVMEHVFVKAQSTSANTASSVLALQSASSQTAYPTRNVLSVLWTPLMIWACT